MIDTRNFDELRRKRDEAINASRLRSLLLYNEDTGEFTWKRRTPDMFSGERLQSRTRRCAIWNSRYANCVAGRRTACNGYLQITVLGMFFYVHRLAWLYINGDWPRGQIDHVNGNRSDNRIVNLRDCSRSENQQNLGRRRSNAGGLLGVNPCSRDNKWRAIISLHGKQHFLGRFETKDDAHSAYLKAKAELHAFAPAPRDGPCEHQFSGWREFEDGCGGEQVCAKCGLGAMSHAMWVWS